MSSQPTAGDSLTLSQRVLLALKETRSKLEAYERAKSEPIAIVGMGCRFPGGADNPELFWDLLCRGVDAIREVPADRWDADAYYDPDPSTPGKTCIRSGGFLPQVDLFDAEFFGISPREARSMDPQQRLLLEVAWEAFENAGQGRDTLFGNRVGVFIGIGNVDYARLMHESARTESIDLYSTTGNVFSAAAGRLSYTLGLQGPCVSLDTACSSSLVSIHLACQSLRTDESVMALAGGVNLILSPQTMIAMSRVPGGLSPDGRCKTFDAAANGLGRGEGCGLVVLKRLSDAIRDRDNIIALIRGSAVNQDGRSAGLTVPNGQAQVDLIEQALANAKVTPDQVSYVETHGPGTALGDPIEVGSLGMVFGRAPLRDRPLILGSVKTNIGHLESAAGVAGLMKTALSLQHGEVPANLNFNTPNPHIPWNQVPITIPTERTTFSVNVRSRIAGVSAFGVAGTNAHAILEEPPRTEERQSLSKVSKHLLTLSAKSERALHELASRYQTHLERQPHLSLADVCFTAAAGRFHFPHRLAILADSVASAREQLGLSGLVFRGDSSAPPKIGFLFPDTPSVNASQPGPKALFPDFASSNASQPGHKVLFPDSDSSNTSQAAHETSLPRHGRAGLQPALQLHENSSVFRNAFDECDRLIQNKAGWSLASPQHNGPLTFSFGYALSELWRSWGTTPTLVTGRGIGEVTACCVAGVLSLEHALELTLAWGRLGETPGAVLAKLLPQLTCSHPRIPIVSHVTGQRITDEMSSPQYWVRAFEATQAQTNPPPPNVNVDALLEADTGTSWDRSLETVANLYVKGTAIDWQSFYRDLPCRRVPLPTYSFQRKRHWFEKKEIRKETETVTTDPFGNLLYEEQWRPQPLTEPSQPESSSPGTWLILADSSGIASQTASHLEANGNTCVIVRPGNKYEETADGTIRVNASSPPDFDQLIARVSEISLPPVKGILHCWSIDSTNSESPSLPELTSELRKECSSLLHLVQAVIRARLETTPKIWLITQGAVQVDAKETPRVTQFPLWGMTGVLEHEHPELGCARLDLDPQVGTAAATRLLSEISLPTEEKRVAYRGQQRFVARLASYRGLPADGATPVALRQDGTYLIAGGLGGLGRLLAEWMIRKGARHIVLFGRSAPKPEVSAWCEELRKSGGTITVFAADVSDPQAVENVLAQLDSAPPLRGIFHSAATLDDGILINQTWEKFERVLRPKVDGAWNLHQLTQSANLDFFVLFSSAASLFGNPGQANYATANAFLDGLARFRRAQGMPGLSINWGIWSTVGGVAENQLDTLINAAGVGKITPAEGLKALERLLSQGSPLQSPAQVAVMPIRWPDFLARAENWHFVDDFRDNAARKTETITPFIQSLMKAPARERRSLLLNHVRSHVDQVLGIRTVGGFNAKQGFFEMGMDSLTAVELKNRLQSALGCKLPSTIAFECPNIDALVDHLAKEELASLFAPADSPVAEPSAASSAGDAEKLVDGLSEEEVTRLMDERLNSIDMLLEK